MKLHTLTEDERVEITVRHPERVGDEGRQREEPEDVDQAQVKRDANQAKNIGGKHQSASDTDGDQVEHTTRRVRAFGE